MVGGYNLVGSGSQFIGDYVSAFFGGIVDKLPDYLPASQVAKYILYFVLISGVCWLIFGFIFQTNEKDD